MEKKLAQLLTGICNGWHARKPYLQDRLLQYILLTRFDKPIGTLLLLWPTLWALWIAAEGTPSLHLLFVFTAGVLLTRSAGVVMNDIADRKFDLHVARTSTRPLTTGRVSPREALLLATTLTLLAFLLVLTTNRLTIMLSVAAIPLACLYPYMKRHTYVPQFFMGLAFSWGIPMAFAAQTGSVSRIAWLLYTANILWAMVYDTIYAMVDREDDIKIGVKSMAILFGETDRFFIGIMQLLFLLVLLLIGIQLEYGNYYYWSLVLTLLLFVYHQYLIRNRHAGDCFRAFLNNNWVGTAVFAGIVLNYLYNR